MKLYNKSELRYSRIFFDKRPPAFAFILIISTAIILSGALVGAAYIPKNYIVKANGNSVITGTEFLSAISSGKVVTLHKSEGDMVNAGDVIISLSSGQEGLQASSLNPNHSYLSQLDVTYKTPDLMSHFLPPHEVSFTFCCSSIVFPR